MQGGCGFYGYQGAFLSRRGTFLATRVKNCAKKALIYAVVRTLSHNGNVRPRVRLAGADCRKYKITKHFTIQKPTKKCLCCSVAHIGVLIFLLLYTV